MFEPPTPGQGARRVWSDSTNRLWLTEWNSGKIGAYDPARAEWREWDLPADNPLPYAIYVDDMTSSGSPTSAQLDRPLRPTHA